MSLKPADMGSTSADCASIGLEILECDICGRRFSSSMTWAWPFCSADIPHELMDSNEQIRRQKRLAETPEKATASYVMPMIKLYGPTRLRANWENGALPEMPETLDVVTLRKQQFREFGDFYKCMGVFVGNVLGKHNWSMLDLLDYSKRWFETPALLHPKKEG